MSEPRKNTGKREVAPPPPPPGTSARRSALDILTLVGKGLTLDDALDECRSFAALDGPDRGLARAIASTVLRYRGGLDHIIGEYIDKPLPKRAARAQDILRIAAAQSLVLKSPDHAVVSTAVAIAQDFREISGYAGLINAVARKIAKAGPASLEKLPERINTPGWMWRGWERAFGPAQARAIARANTVEAALDLTAKIPAEAAEIAEQTGGAVVQTGSVRLNAGAEVTSLAGFDAGRWWVQDAAAALPARLFDDVAGKTVVDLCAAPGGKSMQLAAAGAEVLAVDLSGPRLKRLSENLHRTRLSAQTIKADALDWAPPASVDAVLLDAPCTATGTIRRHPDILWSKTEDDLKALVALQAKMIDRALEFLKPGGVLVYCTCSLQPEEGERQIAALMARRANVSRKPVSPEEIGGLAAITRDGDVRTLPFMMDGMDGFFASRLVKA